MMYSDENVGRCEQRMLLLMVAVDLRKLLLLAVGCAIVFEINILQLFLSVSIQWSIGKIFIANIYNVATVAIHTSSSNIQ